MSNTIDKIAALRSAREDYRTARNPEAMHSASVRLYRAAGELLDSGDLDVLTFASQLVSALRDADTTPARRVPETGTQGRVSSGNGTEFS